MATYLDDVVHALTNLGGTGSLADIYAEVRRLREPPYPASFEAIIRREIENASSDSEVYQGRADLFYSVAGVGAGQWGLNATRDAVPNVDVDWLSGNDPEAQRREGMWQELAAAGGPDGISPQTLREIGVYGGASGIWYDRARTASADSGGVTVGVLHTGRHYSDDLTAERILYHYPRTSRPAGRDAREIAATKAAATLDLPIFVIATGTPASRRNVRRGRIVGHHDGLGIFDIVLEAPFPEHPAAGGIGTNGAKPQAVNSATATKPYARANEEAGSAPRDPFTIDPDKVDRGLKGHAKIQNALADWLASRSIAPESPIGAPNFDLAWHIASTRFVTEVKSLTKTNVAQQLRLGLGQVLDYAQMLDPAGTSVVPVLAVEYQPPERWLLLCDRLGVALVWPGAFERLIPRLEAATES